MPSHTLQLQTAVSRTFRVHQIAGLFDLPLEQLESRLAHSLTVELPGLDEDWTIGAIVGPSGSGKTTLARAVYGDALYQPQPWPDDDAIIDGLGDAPIKQLARVLTAVGLGSVPTWLKPYQLLSTGEQFRADLARAVIGARGRGLETKGRVTDLAASPHQFPPPSPKPPIPSPSLLVIDEFTSTLDRTVAMTTSAALARLLREGTRGLGLGTEGGSITNRPLPPSFFSPSPESLAPSPLRLIVLTCHRDILPWLQPDWTLDLKPPTFDGRTAIPPPLLTRGRLRRPPLRLAVRRVPQKLWAQFARHHYLAGGLAASATCYAAFWEEGAGDWGLGTEGSPRDAKRLPCEQPSPSLQPLAPSPSSFPIAFCASLATLGWKKSKRITRLVTLPEFQGLGIAGRLAETVAAHEAAQGNRVTITASHPAILAHCARSPRWRYSGLKKTGSTRQQLGQRAIRCSTGRAVASFEFVPDR